MIIKFTSDQLNYLSCKDDVMSFLIKKYDINFINTSDDLFKSLVFRIIGQMLSNNVAKILCERLTKLIDVNPYEISKLNVNDFRILGISSKKANYILNLSSNVLAKRINLDELKTLNDSEAVNYLRSIKGIGIWTAEMILLFSLGRLDIWSKTDVALRNGVLKAYPQFKTLSDKRMEMLRRKFTPYCSIASLAFYKLNDDKGN